MRKEGFEPPWPIGSAIYSGLANQFAFFSCRFEKKQRGGNFSGNSLFKSVQKPKPSKTVWYEGGGIFRGQINSLKVRRKPSQVRQCKEESKERKPDSKERKPDSKERKPDKTKQNRMVPEPARSNRTQGVLTKLRSFRGVAIPIRALYGRPSKV